VGSYVEISQFYLLNEIWLYNITNQIYLITLLMVFSLVAYLFIKNRGSENFVLSNSEQYNFLNTISRHSDTADMIIDTRNVIRFANERFVELFRILEYEVDNFHISKTPLPENFKARVLNHKADGRLFKFRTDDRSLLVKVVPVTTDDGEFLGKLVKIRDEKKSVFEDDHVSQWMHELNTPLNAIMGYSELLSDQKNLNETQRSYLKTITEHSILIKDRVGQLLSDWEENDIYSGKNNKRRKGLEKILIVDDVAINRTLLKIMLNRYGYAVNEATNGREALEYVKNNITDLVLMDISMPEMDGIEATGFIRKLDHKKGEVPVIAVTASTRYKNDKTLKEIGFNGLLKKPFKEEELLDMIRKFERKN
jgi:CheY-like chemotaxis protein